MNDRSESTASISTTGSSEVARTAVGVVEELFGPDLPLGVEFWDGTRAGPQSAAATIKVNSVDALVRVLQRPGQLGLARAYVSGDITLDGDVFALLELPDHVGRIRPGISQLYRLAKASGKQVLRRLPVPPEEARLRGRRHTLRRDRHAISHHYDVSSDFYRLVLGPSMTYSCAVWTSPEDGLDQAQANKYDLVCRKLGLQSGSRLLDVGCGWGSMVRHAATQFRANAVGITISEQQYEWACRLTQADSADPQPRFRLLDYYRELDEGGFDAISSIGMSEHVGRSELGTYFRHLYSSLKPGGRLLNHAISALPVRVAGDAGRWPRRLRSPRKPKGFARDSFIGRYVFPDGELVEVGEVISAMQEAGFEVRHVESLREHYGLTLRAWVANLEQHWEQSVRLVGTRRALIWKLYMAGSARTFETGKTGIHQVLAVKPARGRSGFDLRPGFAP